MSETANLANPACRLALAYAPPEHRAFWQSLFALDQRLGRMLAETTEPMLAQIKLAWWRDRLSEQPEQRPSGDQLLDSLAMWRGHEAALTALIDGWEVLLEEELSTQLVRQHIEGRAAPFVELAKIAGENLSAQDCANPAQLWVLSDLISHISSESERTEIIEEFAQLSSQRLPVLPKALRPLSIMAALARRHFHDPRKPILSRRRDALIALRVGIFGR